MLVLASWLCVPRVCMNNLSGDDICFKLGIHRFKPLKKKLLVHEEWLLQSDLVTVFRKDSSG